MITKEWDMTTLWESLESKDYKASLAEYKSLQEQLGDLLKTCGAFIEKSASLTQFDFGKWLDTYLEIWSKYSTLESSLNAYAYCLFATNTQDSSYINNIDALDKLSLTSHKYEVAFCRILRDNKHRLMDFYKAYPARSDYAFFIEDLLEESSHKMSMIEEDLACDMQRTGGSAWQRLQETLTSSMHTKDTNMSLVQLRNLAYNDDAAMREKAYKRELELLEQNSISLGASLNELKGETLTLLHRRKWTALERALHYEKLSRKTLNAMLFVLEESLPLWQKYFKAKALFLHKHKLTVNENSFEKLAFFDLFAPMRLTQDVGSGLWEYEEAKTYIIEQFRKFSDSMAGFAVQAFTSNWIDYAPKANKIGGAFCEDFALQGQSRILCNYGGHFNDVVTLAHELGHAYHHYCISSNDFLLSLYPMTLAETASTFAESLVKNSQIERSDSYDKLYFLDCDLQDASQVFVDILCRYRFEQEVFSKRSLYPLSAKDFCSIMLEEQQHCYGELSCYHPYMWAVKSHYYSTEMDFYNFPYAFAQLLVAALQENYKKQGADSAKQYSDFLRQTGRMSCEDLCMTCGYDISNKAFWQEGMKQYEKKIQAFCALCDKL